MTNSTVFLLLNALVLPWWGLWLLAPRSIWARRAASHTAIFLVLCGVYALLFVAVLADGGLPALDAAGLRAALASPRGFLLGWSHYVAVDLFVGAWILRESRRLDVEPRPYLLLAMLLCPLGLGAFLVRRGLRLRSLGQLGESDLV